jgi:hypothetical protein
MRLVLAVLALLALSSPCVAQQTVVTFVDTNGNRVAVTPDTPLPTTAANGATGGGVTRGAVTDGSGTVAQASTSQQVFPLNAGRSYLMCQNPVSATETLFVNYGAPASTAGGSIELAPGASTAFQQQFIPTSAVNVTAATAGHRFVCKQG